jgi:hypothetical protein
MLIQACSPSTSCVMADPLTRLRLDQISTAFVDLVHINYSVVRCLDKATGGITNERF